MAISISAEVDVRAVQAIASRLAQIDSIRLGQAGVRAVNRTMDEVFPRAIDLMIGGINMSEADVRQRMTLEPANDPRMPQARIIAKKADSRGTTLASYGAKVLTKAVNWPNGSFVAFAWGKNPRKPGWRMPWFPRKGNASLGIPVNQKYAGFTASVRRGVTTLFPTANTYATIIRTKNGRLLPVHVHTDRKTRRLGSAVYGPSVRQLFKHNLGVVARQAERELETTLADEVNASIKEILK